MARSEPIHTYMCIGTAILCFVGVVLIGINLLTDPEMNRGDIGGLIGALGDFTWRPLLCRLDTREGSLRTLS
jgi:hypothetical protein